MGQAKREWMELQELQPMYNWIEENFGDDIDHEDEEAWSLAVEAYHEYLRKTQEEYAFSVAADEYSYFIHLTLMEADERFASELSNLKLLIHDGIAAIPYMFYKMCFAHAVTLFEVYMEGITKSLLLRNPEFLNNYILNSKVIASKNISLKDIYLNEGALKTELTMESLKQKAIADLSSTLFHDVDKTLSILGWILGRDLSIDRAPLKKIMFIRHDIVHRNGVNRDGNEHTIDQSSALDALSILQDGASKIRYEIGKFGA